MGFLRHFFRKNYSLKNEGMFFRITNDAWKTSLSSKEMVSFQGTFVIFWGFGVCNLDPSGFFVQRFCWLSQRSSYSSYSDFKLLGDIQISYTTYRKIRVQGKILSFHGPKWLNKEKTSPFNYQLGTLLWFTWLEKPWPNSVINSLHGLDDESLEGGPSWNFTHQWDFAILWPCILFCALNILNSSKPQFFFDVRGYSL